jgi:hypothetical protein
MRLNKNVATAIVIGALGLVVPAAAQEQQQPEEEQPQAPEPAPPAEQKRGLWGRFALYVETMAGSASSDDIVTSIKTSELHGSVASLRLDEIDNARVSIGWKLPEGRGDFRLVWNAFKETSYEYDASGRNVRVFTGIDSLGLVQTTEAPAPVEWWSQEIRDGALQTRAKVPTWMEEEDDANNDGILALEEIRFDSSPLGTTRSVVDTLENQFQTVDFMYQRDFGGRRINASWGGGARYFVYEGNVPASAWLVTFGLGDPDLGFTDGANLRLLSFSQDSTGFGPVGMAELRLNFADRRVVVYWQVDAAFMAQDSESDSGNFYALIDFGSLALVPEPARLVEERSKDVWHTGAETGVRVRLVSGLHLQLAYHFHAYADAVLMPTTLAVPASQIEAGQGVSALYATRDLRVDGWRGGFSFQF